MGGYSRKDEGCHQFLDLVPKESEIEWLVKREEQTGSHGCQEEKKLELRLGPPGDWRIQDRDHHSIHFPNNPCVRSPVLKPHFLHLQQSGLVPVAKESSQPCNNRALEKKTFSGNSNVPNTSTAQKRTAPGPVVGWPPIRSFRKNLASGNPSKLASESTDLIPEKVCNPKPVENCPKSQFIKINMDGIPIGRKVDLKAHDSYEKLSYAVDELFRGLIAAQRDSSPGRIKDDEEGGKATGSLVEENGEYTLVYEDNEGDRMLVGDVPWHMFVSTVKRLRVLRSSELPTLSRELSLCSGKERI